jgi:hypothetical protein
MGQEYFITTRASATADFIALSVRLAGHRRSEEPPTFEFRADDAPPAPAMPCITITIEPEQLYFCDHGGPREFVAVLFRHFLDAALTHSDWPDGIRVAQP